MLTRIIKKPLFLILAIMAVAIALVSMLAWVALSPIHQKNGFNRKFITTELTMLDVAKKDETVTSMVGETPHHIYFRTHDPAKLWVTDIHLQGGKYISLMNVPNNMRVASLFFTVVDSPAVQIMAGNGPAIITTELNGGSPVISKFPTAVFTRAVTIGPNSYIFRGFDTANKKTIQVFMKGDPKTGELQKQRTLLNEEGGIGSDGYLNYDKKTSLVTYVSFYSNKFYCLDTNLNLVYSGRTIDTMNTVKIETGEVNNIITNVSPARKVNGRSRVANGRLYTLSKLQADNEKGNEFDRNNPVDIYDIKNGEYQGSFYIPGYKREKLIDFKVMDNIVVAVYKGYVGTYRLPATFEK
jgi:hypothetical protein